MYTLLISFLQVVVFPIAQLFRQQKQLLPQQFIGQLPRVQPRFRPQEHPEEEASARACHAAVEQGPEESAEAA